MNWKKLPKQKRDHLILVAVLTAVVLGGWGFGLIRYQYDSLKKTKAKQDAAVADLKKKKELINRAEPIESELAEAAKALAALEDNMATGDPYSWGLDLIRRFRVAYRVDIPAIIQPVVGETTLLPKFPYRQASYTLSGTGYYHDIGKFVADFENQFPQMRIVNLTLTPITSLTAEEKEKLEFKMDIVALVRPNPS